MIRVKRVDHVGIIVGNVEDVMPFYSLLGLRVESVEDGSERGVKLAFLPVGESQLELLEVVNPDGPAGKSIASQGEGIAHICLAVEDIDGAVEELVEAGVKMIDQAPRPGGGGHRIAFVHPDAAHGVRVELLGD